MPSRFKHTLPTTPESNNQLVGIPNSLYRETAMSLVRNSAYTLFSTLAKNKKKIRREIKPVERINYLLTVIMVEDIRPPRQLLGLTIYNLKSHTQNMVASSKFPLF